METTRKSQREFIGGPLDGQIEPAPFGKPPYYLTAEKTTIDPRAGDRLLRHAGIFTAPYGRPPKIRACYYADGVRYDEATGAAVRKYRWVDLDASLTQ